MVLPFITEARRVERLNPPDKRVAVVIDTDTYNEIDDQFAIVHALLSPESMSVEALYAAPFYNLRSESPGDGMRKSFDEIIRLLERLDLSPEGLAHFGSDGFLTSLDAPYKSSAALDLIDRAMASEEDPLYVLAIGALTNIASAMLIEPRIVDRIVVVWLGGHALHWPHTVEFNLAGDVCASRFVLDSGVPLVLIPCAGVTSHLRTTVAEIEQYVARRGAIGDFLAETFKRHNDSHLGWSKELWDVVTVGYLINPDWVPSKLITSPVITQRTNGEAWSNTQTAWRQHPLTWSSDSSRHLIRYGYYVERDPIMRDLFIKLDKWANGDITIP
jgi:purine nucleosidase